MAQEAQLPRSYDSVRAAVVAFMRQCDPYMDRLKDRELLKAEINRLTGGTPQIGTGLKNTGIHRPVDDLGRVVIPRELRRTGEIEAGTPLEFFLDENAKAIILQKYNMHHCTICGDDDMTQLTKIKKNNKHICEECIMTIVEATGE